MQEALKILLLEDEPADAELVQRLLKKANPHYQLSLAMKKETFLQQLEGFRPDVPF